ncbi:MAG: hypothetical protein ACLQU1_07790 [Bryobacteraceae bacterium]
MNCAAWEERILQELEGAADAEAAAHLRNCPACAAFARELAEDTRVLQMAPPEAAAVDYAAIRAVARREALRRRRRRRLLAALAVAAAVLLASRLPLHRELPRTVHIVSAPPPAAPVANVAPVAPVPAVHAAVPRRRKPQSDLDRQFAEYLRSLDESRHPATPPATDSPVVMRIATNNPNVTIILLQESKGKRQ